MAKASGKSDAKSWQPMPKKAASPSSFVTRPFPAMQQLRSGQNATIDRAEVKEPQPTAMIDNINRSLAAVSPPAPSPTMGLNGVQAKLTIGAPGDKYEQEADRMARLVVDGIHAPQDPTPPGESNGNPKPGGVQRQLSIRASGRDGGEVDREWEGELNRARSGGQPLPLTLKEPMERSFGADFGGVRVHTGAQADQLAKSIQAKAFTTGQDVFFRQGAYEPGNRGGQELLAHELSHVVQQNGGEKKAGARNQQRSVIQRYPGVVPDMLISDKEQGLAETDGKYLKSTSLPSMENLIKDTNHSLYQYVISKADEIIIGERTRTNRWAHPNLIGGYDPEVKGAGEIKFSYGIPFAMNNKSGHFRPPITTLAYAESKIRSLFNSAKIDAYNNEEMDLSQIKHPRNALEYNSYGNWTPPDKLIQFLSKEYGGVGLDADWLKGVFNDPMLRRVNPQEPRQNLLTYTITKGSKYF